MTTQLTLAVQLKDNATFTNFLIGKNQATVSYLQAFSSGQGDAIIYLCGASSVGKSHLLQACCHQVVQSNQTAVYIPLKEMQQLSPQILIDLEKFSLVCLDDIDVIAGQTTWEAAIFHLYNSIVERGSRLLFSGNASVQELGIQLPDLRSRLSSALLLPIIHLNDVEKLTALQMRAQQRGLLLTEEVGQFLLNRCPRDMQKLLTILAHLDQASLAEKRKLTIPFIKTVLNI